MSNDNIYKRGDFKTEIPTSVHLVHKNGGHRIISLGFCWAGFFLPTLWALSEGLWRPFALTLPFFFADKIEEALALSCSQNGFCNVIPFVALLKLISFIGYVFTMGYFGYEGKKMLIADSLKHGYFVEGTPRPAEPDEYGS